MIDVDLFAGPGGWEEGVAPLGVRPVGFEWDDAACRTAMAAGHARVRADIARFPVEHLARRIRLLLGSPVCTVFSAAGEGGGRLVLAELEAAIVDALAGRRRMAWHRKRCARVLMAAEPHKVYRRGRCIARSRAERQARAWAAARTAMLVVEPARWIAAARPDYVALEQVPQVLPLWRVYVRVLRTMGYDATCAVLHAEEYGVPQTRTRAILVTSRVGPARLPSPTHQRYRKGVDPHHPGTLWSLPPWVSMADALGWGDVETVSNYGTGGDPRNRGRRGSNQPASTVTSKFDRTMVVVPVTERAVTDPAPTVTSMSIGQWALLRANSRSNASVREVDEPAPTITAGHDSGDRVWLPASWVHERPATTVVGSFGADVISAPGYRTRGGPSRQNAPGGVKVTLEEVSILQGFRRDYPWFGSRSQQHQQAGNAVPPPLACAVVGELLGLDWRAALAAPLEETA